MEPKFEVQLKIRKPVADVFDAVVRPERLKGYFVQSSTGPLAGPFMKLGGMEPGGTSMPSGSGKTLGYSLIP